MQPSIQEEAQVAPHMLITFRADKMFVLVESKGQFPTGRDVKTKIGLHLTIPDDVRICGTVQASFQ